MEKKSFMEISKEECLDSVSFIIENSERHFTIANIVANEKEFGMATAHIVLGVEELTKALFLFAEGIGIRIRNINGAKAFLIDHKTKQFFILQILALSFIINKTFKSIEKFQNSNLLKESILAKAVKSDDSQLIERITNLLIKHKDSSIKKLMSIMDFGLQAENYKMKGFYVDHGYGICTPNDISETESNLAKDFFAESRYQVLRLIESINNLGDDEKNGMITEFNTIELLPKFLQSFKFSKKV